MNDDVRLSTRFFTTVAAFRADRTPHYERFARAASQYLVLRKTAETEYDLGPFRGETAFVVSLNRCKTDDERKRAIWDALVSAHEGKRGATTAGRRGFAEAKRFVTEESLRSCVDGSLRDFWYADSKFRQNVVETMFRSERVCVVTWPNPSDPSDPSDPAEEMEIDCSICIGTCDEGLDKSVMRLPCGHEFHAACLAALRTADHKKCPICCARLKTVLPQKMNVI